MYKENSELAKKISLYHPVGDVALRGVEVDADFCYGLAAEGEALAVVLEVYLLHGRSHRHGNIHREGTHGRLSTLPPS